MKSTIKKTIQFLLPRKLKEHISYEATRAVEDAYFAKYENTNISYSQEGEDLVLERIFGNKNNGFYVDIGAHHPKRFSNTYKFYLKGWVGINIDAMPDSMLPFNEIRPRDINLEVGISDAEGELEYFIFNEPALNTFNKNRAIDIANTTDYSIIDSVIVKTQTVKKILEKYLESGKEIDFMSVDVEGYDLFVLNSNDWNIFRPKYLLIEELNSDVSEIIKKSEVFQFLISKKYNLIARTYNTSIYKAYEVQ